MAGDWIKMRADLQRHPKVVRMASALRADRLRVIGGLHAVWCLFDEHSEDGHTDGFTTEAIDDLIGWQGFCRAMADVHWLDISGEFCSIPRFDEHNGKSAKRRAMETERKRRERAVESGQASASDADKKRSREDKREEKKETPLTPHGGAVRFEDFWSTWPANERKQDKVKCAKKWKASGLDALADTILADIAVKRQTQKWQDGYVEAPLVYLNGKRWEDGVLPVEAGASDASLGSFV